MMAQNAQMPPEQAELLDSEVIFKPRTDYSNKVLRKVLPSVNQKKRKVSISQNIQKFNSQRLEQQVLDGKKHSRLFERGDLKSKHSIDLSAMSYTPKIIKFSSHKGDYLTQTIREDSQEDCKISGLVISEKDLEQSSGSDDSASQSADSSDLAKSDASSNSSSGSSIDLEEDEEDRLYQ